MIGLIDFKSLSKNVIRLLNLSGLIKTQRYNQKLSITSEGFKFVLMKPQQQVNNFTITDIRFQILEQSSNLISKYINLSNQCNRNIIDVLKVIFSLSLTTRGDIYKIKRKNKQTLEIIKDFQQFGFISIIYSQQRQPQFFKITHLLEQFLQSTDTQMQYSFSHSSRQPFASQHNENQQQSQKFIVVQTNFKVFAYTSSELFIAILKLFVDIQMHLPSLVIGSITHKSVHDAYKKGIKAKDLQNFLQARSKRFKPVLQDVPNNQCDQSQQQSKDKKVNQTIPNQYKVATTGNIPRNVAQQLYLWQTETQRTQMKSSILVKDLKNAQHFRRMSDYFSSKKMVEYISQRNQVIVLKQNAETLAHQFISKL